MPPPAWPAKVPGKACRRRALRQSPENEEIVTEPIAFETWLSLCNLKAQYCRLLDAKQWNDWRDLFTEDYEIDVSDRTGKPIVRGRDAVMDWVRASIGGAVTVHHVHTPEFEIDRNEARGVWAMQDTIVYENGMRLVGYGHYHERYIRKSGDWKISRCKLTRLHVDITPPPED